MNDPPAYALEIRRDDVRTARMVAQANLSSVRLEDGEALLRVDEFAFTANNLTYATLGTAGRYWEAFPASENGWGRLPVWGFGTVLRSQQAGVEIGTRYYGYFPIASYLVVKPLSVRSRTFADGAPIRSALNPLYAQYTLAPPRAERDDALALLFRPLLITSFVLDDYLAAQDYFGASCIVVASASSKTAYGMAFLTARRVGAPGLIALTSPRNSGFVASLRSYARVLTYDKVEALPVEPSVYVDFSANTHVRERVSRRLGAALVVEIPAGFTHAVGSALPANASESFFAPSHIKRRMAEWGSDVFAARFEAARSDVVRSLERAGGEAVRIVRGAGPEPILNAYRRALAGELDPREGLILTPHAK